jgi:hypothetical protein
VLTVPEQVPGVQEQGVVGVSRFTIGTPADEVLLALQLAKTPLISSRKIGEDSNGVVAEWRFKNIVLTLRRWEVDGVTAYRVAEIEEVIA